MSRFLPEGWKSHKNRYRFKLRTLTDPTERLTLEAGPFDVLEAGSFGEAEAAKQTARTGREWVYDYERIRDDTISKEELEQVNRSLFERIAMWWAK